MRARLIVASLLVFSVLTSCRSRDVPTGAPAPKESQEWQSEFNLSEKNLVSTGESTYFVLKPGFQLVLEARNDKVTVTVLDETKEINGIVTRVVEERSEEFGEVEETARSFYAMDSQTGDVFYFGTETDVQESGGIGPNDGNWLAFRDGRPGLIMPGSPQVGMRYYQELVPGIAESRAEVVTTTAVVSTPAGVFERVDNEGVVPAGAR
jgi:hypothetical protein